MKQVSGVSVIHDGCDDNCDVGDNDNEMKTWFVASELAVRLTIPEPS